jgi:hypothetical protein
VKSFHYVFKNEASELVVLNKLHDFISERSIQNVQADNAFCLVLADVLEIIQTILFTLYKFCKPLDLLLFSNTEFGV